MKTRLVLALAALSAAACSNPAAPAADSQADIAGVISVRESLQNGSIRLRLRDVTVDAGNYSPANESTVLVVTPNTAIHVQAPNCDATHGSESNIVMGARVHARVKPDGTATYSVVHIVVEI